LSAIHLTGDLSPEYTGSSKKLNFKKINNPMKKWANELNRTFSKEEVQMTKTYEEMLTIPGHKENANQNHIKILPHSSIENTDNKCW
jgi:hypothetical protein